MTAHFVRELLIGIDAVKLADRRELAAYLTAVVSQRGFPLHVASLWNALYFDWDLEEAGYLAPGLNPDRARTTAFGATDEAVPVGGFVRVAAGAAEVWAEVVYKEGRHPAIGPDGVVPGFVSGARAVPTGDPPRAEVSEALILDFAAFGPDWNDAVAIERFKRRGRLDPFGHIVMIGRYEGVEADLDDAAYYARHLLRHHRDGLFAEFVEPGASDEDLAAALLVSLATIAAIAGMAVGLASFSGYFFPVDAYETAINDTGSESAIGTDFFHSIYRGLAVAPRTARVEYAATSRQILGYLERGGGLDDTERALLSGPGWGRLVLFANHYVAARVRDLPDGIEAAYDEGRFHLRRDDAWQAGGIWRTERVDGAAPDIARIPPLIALGLGADEAWRGGATVDFTPGPGIEAPITIDPTLRSWVAVLSVADIDRGALKIGDTRWVSAHGNSQLRLKLYDRSKPLKPLINALVAYHSREREIFGVDWGLEVFAGVKVYCQAGDAGATVRAFLHPLGRPVIIDGQRIEFEYDPGYFGVARRRRRFSSTEMREARSFRDLIALAFRDRGELLPDGSRRLTVTELVAITVGIDAAPATIALVLGTVGEVGILDDGQGTLVWQPVVSVRTRTSDATLINAVGRHIAADPRRWLRPRVVRMHWRRQNPSPDKIAGYHDALRTYGAWGRLAPELPPGRTWVREFEAGGRRITE